MFSRMKQRALQRKVERFHMKRLEGDDSAAAKEIPAWMDLAKFYLKHRYCSKFPYAYQLAIECFRNAAMLGDREGKYQFADHMIKNGVFWAELSQGIMRSTMQESYAEHSFKEAFVYLNEAIEAGHPLAKRLLGLCKIKGWGQTEDSEAGTKLIIESIKEEGKWEQATAIFEGLGLQAPDLFTSLMKHK